MRFSEERSRGRNCAADKEIPQRTERSRIAESDPERPAEAYRVLFYIMEILCQLISMRTLPLPMGATGSIEKPDTNVMQASCYSRLASAFRSCDNAFIPKAWRHMEGSQLLATLVANIETCWGEMKVTEWDELLTELQGEGRISTADRQFLLLKFLLRKRLGEIERLTKGIL